MRAHEDNFDIASLIMACKEKAVQRDDLMTQATFGKAKPESEVPLGLRLLAQVNEEENQELDHI